MHRPPAVATAVLVLALLSIPAAAGEVTASNGQAEVAAGSRFTWPVEGASGDAFILHWEASVPVDVFVVAGNGSAVGVNGTQPLLESLNATQGQATLTLPGDGPFTLVVDNTDGPANGAPGTSASHVTVSVTPLAPTAQPPSPGADGQETRGPSAAREEDPTLWNTLMFDAHHWVTGAPIEFASVGLWMVVLLVVACIGFASPFRDLATLAGFAALFVTLWALVPYIGELTEIGPPALAGLALAWVAVKRTTNSRDALQLAFVAAVLGAFAGVLVAFALKHLWSDPSTLYLGGRRFTDVLFTLPGFAVAGVILFKVIPDIVHAIDDANADEPRGTATTAGQGEVFQVTCLRCHTEIKVDRSMKRFRVATDRFEFACPNCQYWMEWSDPGQKQGAAAA